MLRSRVILASLIALALAGCRLDGGGGGSAGPSPPMPSSDAGAPASDKPDSEQQRQKMVYSHALELISQPDTILKHFSRARDRCLNDAQLDCILLGGNANAGDARAHLAPSAQLVVMLPHNQVPGFKRGLMAALPGMEADITLRSEKIDADNVTQQIVDIDQRAKQLTLYRDSLMAIARQPNITVTELVDLQNKIAEAQTQIDALATEKTGIMDRVRRERVTMQFAVDAGVSDAARPIAEAWDTSFELFGRSASTLLQLLVVLLPWLVSGAFVWLIVRLVRGRKRAAPAAATRGAGGPPMMAPA